MPLSSKINHIINKISKFIYNIKEDNYSDNEQRDYKLSSIIYLLEDLISTETLGMIQGQIHNLSQTQFELETVKRTLVGDLSLLSLNTALAVMKKFRAQLKGLYSIVSAEESRDENGEFEESYYEQFEPFIDPETGEIFEEQDTEVRDAFYSKTIQSNQSEIDSILDTCTKKISKLTLTHQEKFSTTIEDVDVFISPKLGEVNRDNRIKIATTEYFKLSQQDVIKLDPKIQKSVLCRKNLAEGDNQNNLDTVNSREVILTMIMAIKQLKAEKHSPGSSEEYLQFSEETSVRVAHMPSEKNLSNVFINHLGTYGRYKKNNKIDSQAVLSIFEAIEEKLGHDRLVKIMLQFGCNPSAVTVETCGLNDTLKNQTLYRGFIRALTLVFQAEIWRYLPIDVEEPVRNISFAMGLAEGLELLEEDSIELKDLFDADAVLGLPTGQKILHSYDQIKAKQETLHDLARENLVENDSRFSDFVESFPNAELVPSKSEYTEKLKRTFGTK